MQLKAKIYKEIERYLKRINQKKRSFFYHVLNINNESRTSLEKSQIVIYFSGNPRDVNKIVEWYDVLEQLHEKHPITVVVRNYDTYKALQKSISFPIYLAIDLNSVLTFYARYRPNVVLYMHQHIRNSQSLTFEDSLHVYIDGDNEPSNQVKAYDYIFIDNEELKQSYMSNLLKVNASKFINIGRALEENPEKSRNTMILNMSHIVNFCNQERQRRDMHYV